MEAIYRFTVEFDSPKCSAVCGMLALFTIRHARTAEAFALAGLPRLALSLRVLLIGTGDALSVFLWMTIHG